MIKMESFVIYHNEGFDDLVLASDYITDTLKTDFRYFEHEETLTGGKKAANIQEYEKMSYMLQDGLYHHSTKMGTFKGLTIVSDTLFDLSIGGHYFLEETVQRKNSYFMYTNDIRLKGYIGIKYVSSPYSQDTLKQQAIDAIKKENGKIDKNLCSEDLCDYIDYIDIMEKIPEKFKNGTWYRYFISDEHLIFSAYYHPLRITFVSENATYYMSGFGAPSLDEIEGFFKPLECFHIMHTDGYQLSGTKITYGLSAHDLCYDFTETCSYEQLFIEKSIGYEKNRFKMFLKYQEKKGIKIDPDKLYPTVSSMDMKTISNAFKKLQ